jgi:hypothetical protein
LVLTGLDFVKMASGRAQIFLFARLNLQSAAFGPN